MDITIATVFVLTGFAVMIYGADRLIAGATNVALTYKIPKVFVGAVIVGLGTSAPELFTSLYSAYIGEGLLSSGNVIGSNSFNTTVVMAACLLFVYVPTAAEKSFYNLFFILFPCLLLFVLLRDLNLSRIDGFILLAVLPIYIYTLFKHPQEENLEMESKSLFASFFWVVAGIGLLFGGSKLAINGSLSLITLLGLSKSFAGAVILAVGTSLPELVTTIIAGLKKETSLAIANITGSNALNIFLVLGSSGAIFPFDVDASMAFFTLPLLIGFSILIIPMMYIHNKHLARASSMVLLSGYIFFAYNSF